MSTEASISSVNLSPALSRSRYLGRAVAVLAVVMCLYLGSMVWAVRGDLARAIDQFSTNVLPSTIGLVLLGLALRAVRWHYHVIRLRWGVLWHHSVAAFLASFAFTATPGKAGEVVKSLLLRTRYNVSVANGLGVLLVERLGDLLAVLILASGGLGLLSDATVYFLATALIVSASTLFLNNRWIYFPTLSKVARVPKLSGIAHKLLQAFDTCRALLPIPFLLGVGIALIAWACEGWAFHLVILHFGVKTDFLQSFSIYGVATLVGALSALPGGLGSFEVAMVLLLSQRGMSLAAATVPIVVFRFCSLWLASLIGVIFMFGWLWLMGSNQADVSSRGLK